MAGDRLSELPDDLLRRVLHFAPSKEAVSTGALSRRFRSLWRASAAVNPEARIPRDVQRYNRTSGQEDARFFALHTGFLSAAMAALEAAAADGVLVTRLTFRVEACWGDSISAFLDRLDPNVFAAVLSHRASRRVQELRLAAVEGGGFTRNYEPYPSHSLASCNLCFGSLPWETLRVLDLTGCRLGGRATPLARADLRFISDGDLNKDSQPGDTAILWKLLYEFRHAKELKLAVRGFKDIAIVRAAERTELLCKNGFHDLVCLELEGVHKPKGKTAAVAIANLLRCCPVLRDLRINLNTAEGESSKESRHVHEFLQRKSRDDLDESMGG
ncbi:hypothetical protein BRADI_4g11790v3 [Brachypodium distachyon]|uniref:F-box domain-containing protein n=1 Tax=Brachypodium distachyon TaxID=15368 RepID=A0A2K2CM75_BRADI|nr:hypothetical protein BRADI_4g11790v3 [Brachypodium distachyon]